MLYAPPMPARTRAPKSLWDRVTDDAHRDLILEEYRRLGVTGRALAAHLGVSTGTLYREIERLGLRQQLGVEKPPKASHR